MRPKAFRWLTIPSRLAYIALAALCWGVAAAYAADQVQMQNGDRYIGKVVSLNSDTLVLQSDVLGAVRLPRSKVALISLGAPLPVERTTHAAVSNSAAGLLNGTATNSPNALAEPLRQLASNPALIQQIETQFLSDATPEAKDKFNELLGGLMTGKLGVADVRAQAQATAAQVRAMRKDLGDEAGWMLDTYLAILDNFVKETAPAGPPSSSPPITKPAKPDTNAEAD